MDMGYDYSNDVCSKQLCIFNYLLYNVHKIDFEGRFLYKIRHAGPVCASPKPRGARATQKIVDDSDYKRICLCSLLCSWNSSIISDSIHLISPSQQDLSSFLDESSLLCLIFFSSSKHTFRHQNQSSDVVTNSFCLVSCQISFQLHFTLLTQRVAQNPSDYWAETQPEQVF